MQGSWDGNYSAKLWGNRTGTAQTTGLGAGRKKGNIFTEMIRNVRCFGVPPELTDVTNDLRIIPGGTCAMSRYSSKSGLGCDEFECVSLDNPRSARFISLGLCMRR